MAINVVQPTVEYRGNLDEERQCDEVLAVQGRAEMTITKGKLKAKKRNRVRR